MTEGFVSNGMEGNELVVRYWFGAQAGLVNWTFCGTLEGGFVECDRFHFVKRKCLIEMLSIA